MQETIAMTITSAEKSAFSARLRSDEFAQIRGTLADRRDGRCALGVLCETLGYSLDGACNPIDAYDFLKGRGIEYDLFWYMNDHQKKSFVEIADAIDAMETTANCFNFNYRPNPLMKFSMADR